MILVEVANIDVLYDTGRDERPMKLNRGVRGQYLSLSTRSGSNPYAKVTRNRKPKATK